MSKLEGKVALVSGSGRGIGRCIALKLAAEGARVVVNDMDEAPASETVAAIRAAGGEAVACVGSVTATDFAERFVGTAIGQYKGLDIIVNNAGYTWDNVIQKMTDEQWYAMLDVHLTAPFRILRAAAGFIRQASRKEAEAGSDVYRKVVNISSLAGIGGNAGQANYAAAKAGVIGLTAALAKEWGRYKVNVNCVAFGFIQTRLTTSFDDPASKIVIEGKEVQAGVPGAALSALPAMVPLGRAGTPDEAAGGVYLFCIPESDYVSGQVLLVGGGIST